MGKISDPGSTRLRNGRRVAKNHPLICVGGELDELSSILGAALAALGRGPGFDRLGGRLREIQSVLLEAGCALSGPAPKKSEGRLEMTTRALEISITELARDLPPLRCFILPGGSSAGAWLHLARAVCRRAERAAAGLPRTAAVLKLILFLNRLSGWLFCAARRVNAAQRRPEPLWPVVLGRKRR